MMQNAILFPKQPFAKVVVDDTDVVLKVRYVGSQASASVEVSSAGDLTFKHGAVGALVVDSTIDSGGNDDGVIDVSDANANTYGKVVDLINASPNWEAYLVGGLRSDNANASTGSLLAKTAVVMTPNVTEVDLQQDTSKVLNMSVRVGKRANVVGSEEKAAAEIYSITSTNTFGSGTSKIQVYEIDEIAKSETKIYELAGGATTVQDTKNFVVNGRGSLASSKVGNHLIVRLIGSAACTGNLQVVGATACGS
ncbi:MAG TPA: hypothetical protein PKN54_04450 [Candidatus Cloacimonas acidaminovorans]|nr:hypothetical protein [Candidatus Cloacimonas acidaminovorans]